MENKILLDVYDELETLKTQLRTIVLSGEHDVMKIGFNIGLIVSQIYDLQCKLSEEENKKP